jgi:histidinol-phosphatase
LADVADVLSLARFRDRDLTVSTKPDLTPVTDADRAVEQALRDRIIAARPGHGIVGEEFEPHAGGSGRRWILDPIDGTKNYVRGIPIWATCIALQHDDRVVVGVVSAPALGRRWWAARGTGAFADDRPIRVSKVAQLADAQLSYDSVPGFEAHGMGERFLDLARRCWRTRGLGDFWSHVLVAEGAIDVGVEPEVSLWDVAAIQVIVEEAGGRFTDLAGTARPDGGSAVSTNGLLHEDVLAALRSTSPGSTSPQGVSP